MKKIICLLFTAIICGITSHLTFADFSTPVSPAEDDPNNYIGILLGFGQNMQSGTSTVNCPECLFQDGVGFGYTFGLTYEKQFIKDDDSFFHDWYYGGMLHLSNGNFSATYREIQNEQFMDDAYSPFNIPITYRHTNNISIMNAGLTPFISYYPIDFMFIRLGIDASAIFHNSTKHTLELVDRRTELPNGEIVEIYIQHDRDINRKTYSTTLQDESIKDLNRLQFAFTSMIGGNVYLSDKLIFSPSLSFAFPFTKISNSNNYSVNNWRFNVEFRYNIAQSYSIYKGSSKKKIPVVKKNR